MRSLILLLLGLAVGAVAAASVINALQQRDAYPRGLMNVMQHHFAALRSDVRAGQCAKSPTHVGALTSLRVDIDNAIYADDSPESAFLEYEHRLDEALAIARNAAADCAALAPAIQKIGAACDACHHQYR